MDIHGTIFDIRHPTKLYKKYKDTPFLPILQKFKQDADTYNASWGDNKHHRKCVFEIKIEKNFVCFVASSRHHEFELYRYELKTDCDADRSQTSS